MPPLSWVPFPSPEITGFRCREDICVIPVWSILCLSWFGCVHSAIRQTVRKSLLRAGCWLISLAEKELTTSSNCSGKQRHDVILRFCCIKKWAWLIEKPFWLFLGYIPVCDCQPESDTSLLLIIGLVMSVKTGLCCIRKTHNLLSCQG